MKIAFHDNSICMRGTTVALYDYAFFSRKYLGIEPIVIYNLNHPANDESVIKNKFEKEFPVFGYNSIDEMDKTIESNSVDRTLFIKCGQRDGVISRSSENMINAISPCQMSDIHAERFAMCSEWLSKLTNYQIPYVPFMVYLPDINGNMREELNIPKDTLVIGRNGGYTTFDLDFVKKAIMETINSRKDVYYVFQCTEPFMEHERIIYLDCSPDLEIKTRYINTCDVMLHARHLGEGFGLSPAEFSIRNKRVMMWTGSKEVSHVDTFKEKGIYYNTYEDIKNLLLNLSKKDLEGDWNCYKENTPEKVIKKFEEIYIK